MGWVDVLYSKLLLGGSVRAESTPTDYEFVRCHLEHATMDYIPQHKATILRSVYMFSTLPVGSPEEDIMADCVGVVVASWFAMSMPATSFW